jgi:hypothetical protein
MPSRPVTLLPVLPLPPSFAGQPNTEGAKDLAQPHGQSPRVQAVHPSTNAVDGFGCVDWFLYPMRGPIN